MKLRVPFCDQPKAASRVSSRLINRLLFTRGLLLVATEFNPLNTAMPRFPSNIGQWGFSKAPPRGQELRGEASAIPSDWWFAAEPLAWWSSGRPHVSLQARDPFKSEYPNIRTPNLTLESS